MTRPGIEPRSPGPLTNILLMRPNLEYVLIFVIRTDTHTQHTHTYIYICVCVCVRVRVCVSVLVSVLSYFQIVSLSVNTHIFISIFFIP